MNKPLIVLLVGLFAANLCFAQAADCESQAVGRDGKPLVGAAKASFVKKCQADVQKAVRAACATKAVDKNGKALAGAAKASFLKKCEVDAGK